MPLSLPGGDRLQIPDRKIVDYLLSSTHPVGHGKAAWFVDHGFSSENPKVLAEALRHHATSHPVTKQEDTPFGTR